MNPCGLRRRCAVCAGERRVSQSSIWRWVSALGGRRGGTWRSARTTTLCACCPFHGVGRCNGVPGAAGDDVFSNQGLFVSWVVLSCDRQSAPSIPLLGYLLRTMNSISHGAERTLALIRAHARILSGAMERSRDVFEDRRQLRVSLRTVIDSKNLVQYNMPDLTGPMEGNTCRRLREMLTSAARPENVRNVIRWSSPIVLHIRRCPFPDRKLLVVIITSRVANVARLATNLHRRCGPHWPWPGEHLPQTLTAGSKHQR